MNPQLALSEIHASNVGQEESGVEYDRMALLVASRRSQCLVAARRRRMMPRLVVLVPNDHVPKQDLDVRDQKHGSGCRQIFEVVVIV